MRGSRQLRAGGLVCGSSPRMRGSLYPQIQIQIGEGIIPAHAGLTIRQRPARSGTRDHPRACGAHIGEQINKARSTGSSPRMRGSPHALGILAGAVGIIPAHAGLTHPSSPKQCHAGDHPRACGAHNHFSKNASSEQGSSPRMRGSLHRLLLAMLSAGIIPAHAGLTCSGCRHSSAPWDHPRACGAHRLVKAPASKWEGSSPRMRGSLILSLNGMNSTGIIPAHAGLTPIQHEA